MVNLGVFQFWGNVCHVEREISTLWGSYLHNRGAGGMGKPGLLGKQINLPNLPIIFGAVAMTLWDALNDENVVRRYGIRNTHYGSFSEQSP